MMEARLQNEMQSFLRSRVLSKSLTKSHRKLAAETMSCVLKRSVISLSRSKMSLLFGLDMPVSKHRFSVIIWCQCLAVRVRRPSSRRVMAIFRIGVIDFLPLEPVGIVPRVEVLALYMLTIFYVIESLSNLLHPKTLCISHLPKAVKRK